MRQATVMEWALFIAFAVSSIINVDYIEKIEDNKRQLELINYDRYLNGSTLDCGGYQVSKNTWILIHTKNKPIQVYWDGILKELYECQ